MSFSTCTVFRVQNRKNTRRHQIPQLFHHFCARSTYGAPSVSQGGSRCTLQPLQAARPEVPWSESFWPRGNQASINPPPPPASPRRSHCALTTGASPRGRTTSTPQVARLEEAQNVERCAKQSLMGWSGPVRHNLQEVKLFPVTAGKQPSSIIVRAPDRPGEGARVGNFRIVVEMNQTHKKLSTNLWGVHTR